MVRGKIGLDNWINKANLTENLRDKLFDRDTVRAISYALYNSDVNRNVIDFFSVAMAHGMSFPGKGRMVLKYLQGGFGMGYLTLQLLPHLGVQ